MNEKEFSPENVFADSDDYAQLLLSELLTEFMRNFPPGSVEEHDPDHGMNTEEIFMLIDNHVPDITTHYELAALLHKNGYITRYDPGHNEFKWLIK